MTGACAMPVLSTRLIRERKLLSGKCFPCCLLHLCVYIFMYICMYMYMHRHVSVCIYMWYEIYANSCMCASNVCACVVRVCVHYIHTCICTTRHTYIHTRVVRVCICSILTCICTYMHMYNMCRHAYTHIQTQKSIHTCMNTHAHT